MYVTVRSLVVGVVCNVFVIFVCNLFNSGIDGLYLQVLHESAVLKHGTSTFKASTLDKNNMTADATGWLG